MSAYVDANSPADISIRKCNCVANEAFKKGKEEGKRRTDNLIQRERINHASEQTAPFAPLKGLGKGEPHGCIDNDGTRQRYRYITLCRARTKRARGREERREEERRSRDRGRGRGSAASRRSSWGADRTGRVALTEGRGGGGRDAAECGQVYWVTGSMRKARADVVAGAQARLCLLPNSSTLLPPHSNVPFFESPSRAIYASLVYSMASISRDVTRDVNSTASVQGEHVR